MELSSNEENKVQLANSHDQMEPSLSKISHIESSCWPKASNPHNSLKRNIQLILI